MRGRELCIGGGQTLFADEGEPGGEGGIVDAEIGVIFCGRGGREVTPHKRRHPRRRRHDLLRARNITDLRQRQHAF